MVKRVEHPPKQHSMRFRLSQGKSQPESGRPAVEGTMPYLCETTCCFEPDFKLASLACGVSLSGDTPSPAHTASISSIIHIHAQQTH